MLWSSYGARPPPRPFVVTTREPQWRGFAHEVMNASHQHDLGGRNRLAADKLTVEDIRDHTTRSV